VGTDAYSHAYYISDEMSVTKSHALYMLGNSLLDKLWNIITGCIVSLILCSIVVSSTSWKQCGEGTGDVSLSVELVDRSSTTGRPRHCRSCCPLEKLSLVHRLIVSCSVIH